MHPDGDVLASAGLDRYLRLSCTRTRRLLAKVYLKTLPTGVAFCPADASMLAPLEQPAAEDKAAAARRRRRSEDGGSDDSEEEEDEEAAPQRTHKRSKQRGEGSSSGRRHKGGKRSGRPREEQ